MFLAGARERGKKVEPSFQRKPPPPIQRWLVLPTTPSVKEIRLRSGMRGGYLTAVLGAISRPMASIILVHSMLLSPGAGPTAAAIVAEDTKQAKAEQ